MPAVRSPYPLTIRVLRTLGKHQISGLSGTALRAELGLAQTYNLLGAVAGLREIGWLEIKRDLKLSGNERRWQLTVAGVAAAVEAEATDAHKLSDLKAATAPRTTPAAKTRRTGTPRKPRRAVPVRAVPAPIAAPRPVSARSAGEHHAERLIANLRQSAKILRTFVEEALEADEKVALLFASHEAAIDLVDSAYVAARA